MRCFNILYLLALMLIAQAGFGQVGEYVSAVKVLNEQNDTVSLPYLGEKNILIFYADPSHPGQNKDFRNYVKTHPITNPAVVSYGVVNMGAAPMIPNGMIRRMALKEVKGTDGHLYFDPNKVLSTAWRLPGANNNFTVIFVDKDKIIRFYKAGQLTPEEQQKVIDLVYK